MEINNGANTQEFVMPGGAGSSTVPTSDESAGNIFGGIGDFFSKQWALIKNEGFGTWIENLWAEIKSFFVGLFASSQIANQIISGAGSDLGKGTNLVSAGAAIVEKVAGDYWTKAKSSGANIPEVAAHTIENLAADGMALAKRNKDELEQWAIDNVPLVKKSISVYHGIHEVGEGLSCVPGWVKAPVVAAAVPILAYPIAIGEGTYLVGKGAYTIKKTEETYEDVDNAFKPDMNRYSNFAGAEARILGNPQMVEKLAEAGVPRDKDGKISRDTLNTALADPHYGQAVQDRLKALIIEQRNAAEQAVKDHHTYVPRYIQFTNHQAKRRFKYESAMVDARSMDSAAKEMDNALAEFDQKRDNAEKAAAVLKVAKNQAALITNTTASEVVFADATATNSGVKPAIVPTHSHSTAHGRGGA